MGRRDMPPRERRKLSKDARRAAIANTALFVRTTPPVEVITRRRKTMTPLE